MPSSRFKKHLLNSQLKTLIVVASSLSFVLFLSSSSSLNSVHSNARNAISDPSSVPTSIDHIVFGIASSTNSWTKRKEYVKMWWNPNHMRGCIFLDAPVDNETVANDEPVSPPIFISNDTSRFRYTWNGGLRSAIRVARVVSETVALNHSNVRWFVFGDDDTLFFPENLAKTLSKYDHGLWYYIGSTSESYVQNRHFSFSMAYGGAGFAISYPLATVLAKVLDSCLERYPHLYGSDSRISSCLAELGVTMTNEPGFHQMDLTGNAFGFLMTHPMRPLVSLHHPDRIDPIFPNMTEINGLRHLYEAAKFDPLRILQQTVCYDPRNSWTISISWGYAIEVFRGHLLLPDVLRVPLSFRPWIKTRVFSSFFNFDMRQHHNEPCRRPVVFHMDKVYTTKDGITSIYRVMERHNCTSGTTSPRRIEQIKVHSQILNLDVKQMSYTAIPFYSPEESLRLIMGKWKLTGQNFPVWKLHLDNVLSAQGKLYVIQKPPSRPKSNSPEKEFAEYFKYMADESDVMSILSFSTSPEFTVDLRVKYCHEVMKSIEDQVGFYKNCGKFLIMKEIFSLRLEIGQSVKDHLLEMRRLFKCLSRMGYKMVQEELVYLMWFSLPKEIRVTASGYMGEPKMDVAKVHEDILASLEPRPTAEATELMDSSWIDELGDLSCPVCGSKDICPHSMDIDQLDIGLPDAPGIQ